MVELVRAGRSPDELAKEFEPTAQSIRNWVAQAERDAGRRLDGLTSEERQELARLRRENRVLRKSARYYQKPRPGSRRRPVRCRHGVRIRERESGHVQDCDDVSGAGSLHQRVLRVVPAGAVAARPSGRGTQLADASDS
jgi:transposase